MTINGRVAVGSGNRDSWHADYHGRLGRLMENDCAECLTCTVKKGQVYLNEYQDCEDAYDGILCFLDDVYMTRRMHPVLGCYVTPSEFDALEVAQPFV